ncbi:MAG: hypothetical protein ACQEQ7_14635 [Thermodesulfobacteriota bacterium]
MRQVLPPKEIPIKEIVPHLLCRLSDKGFYPEEIPNLLEDLLYMVADGGYFSTEDINQGLERLGWSPVDSVTIELVLCLLEAKGEYEVRCYDFH